MKTAIAIICMSALFVLSVSHSPEDYRKPEAYQIRVTYLPDNCEKINMTQKRDVLYVHYNGTFENGTEFNSSYAQNKTLKFTLGIGEVMRGWDKGLLNMCVDEARELIIGSDLAYGAEGNPPKIPPYTTLYFEIKLMAFKHNPSTDELNEGDDTDPIDPPGIVG